jgi:hypothetical protein
MANEPGCRVKAGITIFILPFIAMPVLKVSFFAVAPRLHSWAVMGQLLEPVGTAPPSFRRRLADGLNLYPELKGFHRHIRQLSVVSESKQQLEKTKLFFFYNSAKQ